MSNTINTKHRRKVLIQTFKGRGRRGVVNDCMKPSLGASKADLAEYHAEEMRHRKHRQRNRKPNVLAHRPSKSDSAEYRKPFVRDFSRGA